MTPKVRLKPPAGAGPTAGVSVFGCRYYSCAAGGTVDVPIYDAAAMQEAGWQLAEGLASLKVVADGERFVLALVVDGMTCFVGPSGLTTDIARATDIRGPAAIAWDGAASLTLDPATGDVLAGS